MTRRDERLAGLIGLLTSVLLATSLLLHGTGPTTRNPNGVVAWYAGREVTVRVGSLAWLAAMLALVVFAVLLRDALVTLTADRWWAAVLFVQGAAVFATIAVIAAATSWVTATLAVRADVVPTTVAAMSELHRTLLRFASWGLTVPVLTVGLTLARHSRLGRIVAVLGACVAVALLVPLTWGVGLPAFTIWLLLTAVALLSPRSPRLRRRGGSDGAADSSTVVGPDEAGV